MTETELLNNIFDLLKLEAECKDFHQYKRSHTYDIALKPRGRIKNIERVLNEITMMLKITAKPNLFMCPEDGLLKLEYILPATETVNLFEMDLQQERPEGQLQCLLGETLRGDQMWFDLADAPHVLIAGTTGSGKSTLIHSLIANLLMYDDVSIDIIDPKNIEFAQYESFSQVRVSNTYQQAMEIINELCVEMESRYEYMREKNKTSAIFPYHVLIVDEFADLILQDEIDEFQIAICKLAQKSRAAGIHLILATQRPAASILNGNIKANFPTRLACRVSSGIDSRIILDQMGAEQLQGRGDTILKTSNNDTIRFQGAYCSPSIVKENLYA